MKIETNEREGWVNIRLSTNDSESLIDALYHLDYVRSTFSETTKDFTDLLLMKLDGTYERSRR
tara:strand:- start:223 stop:411 length:189 start_codon:yes stop_codon:yes gene_type:complete